MYNYLVYARITPKKTGIICRSMGNKVLSLYPKRWKRLQETLTLGSLSEIPREFKCKAFVYKQSHMLLSKRVFNMFGCVWKPYNVVLDHWSYCKKWKVQLTLKLGLPQAIRRCLSFDQAILRCHPSMTFLGKIKIRNLFLLKKV